MKTIKILHSTIFSILVGGVFLIPLFVYKGSNPYLSSKQFIFFIVVSLLFLLSSVKIILEKKSAVYMSTLHTPLRFLLVAFVLSVIFGEKTNWIFGRNEYFVLSLFGLLAFVLFTFFIIQNTTGEIRKQIALGALATTGSLASIVFLLRSIFGFEVLKFIQPGLWNNIDLANTNFAVFALVIFLISFGEVLRLDLDKKWQVVHLISAILSFATIVTLGFKVIWAIGVFGLVLQALIAYKFKNVLREWSSMAAGILAVFLVALIFFGPIEPPNQIPAEAALGIKPSWSIVSSSLFSGATEFLFGAGPGSFNILFSKFRETVFNMDPAASALRFNYPASSLFAFAAEGGILFVLAFLSVVAAVVLSAVYSLRPNQNEAMPESDLNNGFLDLHEQNNPQVASALLLVSVWLSLTVGTGVLFFNFTLWWLWWFLLGLVIVSLAFVNPDLIRIVNIDLEKINTNKYVAPAGIGGVLLLSVIFNVFNLRVYFADQLFAAALAASDFATAEDRLEKAIKLRPSYDLYHSVLSRAYFNDAATKSKEQNPDLKAISSLLGESVKEARLATEISPKKVAFWENLADIYDNSSTLVPEAADWALRSLAKASELEPSNSFLAASLGKLYEKQGKTNDAIKQYETAIALKSDYWEVYTLLSNLYEKQNDPNKAILTFEAVIKAVPSNIEVRYNYGRLIYNRNQTGDREFAEKIWLAISEEAPTYSNALYSLGLLNELKGKTKTALQYYYKVRDLNPDNKDVKAKIAKLER